MTRYLSYLFFLLFLLLFEFSPLRVVLSLFGGMIVVIVLIWLLLRFDIAFLYRIPRRLLGLLLTACFETVLCSFLLANLDRNALGELFSVHNWRLLAFAELDLDCVCFDLRVMAVLFVLMVVLMVVIVLLFMVVLMVVIVLIVVIVLMLMFMFVIMLMVVLFLLLFSLASLLMLRLGVISGIHLRLLRGVIVLLFDFLQALELIRLRLGPVTPVIVTTFVVAEPGRVRRVQNLVHEQIEDESENAHDQHNL